MPTGTPPIAAPPAASRPKLRWYQFSLRSLMLFVLVCAIACSWFATRMERASRQKAAVEAILKVSGLYVEYDDLIGDDGRWDNSKIAALHDPGWLERVLGRDFCHNVRAVSYSRTLNFPPGSVGVHDVPTETLQRLKDMPDLRYLDLSWKNVTDADLIYVLPLVQLRHLEVLGTKVTDAGVRRLQEALPNCKIVH